MKTITKKTVAKLLLISFLGMAVSSQAQMQFDQILASQPTSQIISDFEEISDKSIAFGDVDEDALITGLYNSNQGTAKSHTNASGENFTEMIGIPFDGVRYGSTAFADVDGDGDEDMLMTGLSSSNQRISKLYTNDGMGNFIEVAKTPFEGVFLSSIAFKDVDGDGDKDVLITGRNKSKKLTAKLYTNDGLGNFTNVKKTPFEGVWHGSVAFADVDADGDEDVLITGQDSYDHPIAKLYTNDGNGNFTETTKTPFDGVTAGSIAFEDVDADGDKDVLITGQNSSDQRIAKLYINDGSGNFTEVTGTAFKGVYFSSITFMDIDSDDDKDVLVAGLNNDAKPITKLYTNDGSGNFSEVTETPFDGVFLSSIAYTDMDKNAYKDVLITGLNSSNQCIAKLYTNDGRGNFTEMQETSFEGVRDGSVAFTDVDEDDDDDVLIIGLNNSGQPIAKLYRNLLFQNQLAGGIDADKNNHNK